MSLDPGTMLFHYRHVEILGQRSMGHTWRVADTKLPRRP